MVGWLASGCAIRTTRSQHVVFRQPIDEGVIISASLRYESSFELERDVLTVRGWRSQSCRTTTGERRVVETRVVRRQHPLAVAAEVACATVGGGLAVYGASCPDDEWTCLERYGLGLAGGAAMLACGGAVLHEVVVPREERRRDAEQRTSVAQADCSRRLESDVPVAVRLPDGVALRATSDAEGKARFDLADAPWVDGRLRIGLEVRGVAVRRHTLQRASSDDAAQREN